MDGIPAGFGPPEREPGNLVETVGPFYINRATDPARYGILLTEAHSNFRGVTHGGLLMTFADQMLGYAVTDAVGGEPVATLSLTCEFVRAGLPGNWIEGTPELVRLTRSVVFVRGTLRRGDEVVMTATGVWKRLGKG